MANKPVPIETKQLILEDAKKRILDGETLEQIAVSHNITGRTLSSWLAALGDEYVELRQAWIDSILSDAEGEIRNATDTFQVARARELWKSATWYAERRDRLRYGQQVANINIINGVTLSDALQGEAITLLDSVTDT